MLNNSLFSPAYLGIPLRSSNAASVSFPHSSFDTLDGLKRDSQAVTPNSGNMIHAEAMPRIVDCNRSNSVVGGLPRLADASPEVAHERLRKFEERAKVVFLSFANIIHDKSKLNPDSYDKLEKEFGNTALFIKGYSGKIIVTGIGLQDEMEPVEGSIQPALYRMLEAINEKAAIFGVRGERTEAWLHELGLRNAVALGCPSLYVNPWAIESIRPVAWEAIERVTTAGYLTAHGWRIGRLKAVVKFASAFRNCDYVFQNDLYQFADVPHDTVRYNFLTGEIDKSFSDRRFEKTTSTASPFKAFRYFNNPDLWRGYVSQRDFYFGDRFHGGVAHLQVGIPAAFIYNDPRVKELTSFFGMPAFSVEEANELTPREIVARSTSESAIAHLKARYAVRLGNFKAAMAAAGVPLHLDGADTAALARPGIAA